MSQVQTPSQGFDPLDMRNYTLEKLPEMGGGVWMDRVKFAGVPLAIFFFLYFDLRWCGTIGVFEAQTKVAPAHCYAALAIFVSSLILWLSESIPNYLTSFLIIVAAILTGVMPAADNAQGSEFSRRRAEAGTALFKLRPDGNGKRVHRTMPHGFSRPGRQGSGKRQPHAPPWLAAGGTGPHATFQGAAGIPLPQNGKVPQNMLELGRPPRRCRIAQHAVGHEARKSLEARAVAAVERMAQLADGCQPGQLACIPVMKVE